MSKSLLLLLIILLLLSQPFARRQNRSKRGVVKKSNAHKSEIPIRLDIHLTGGSGLPLSYGNSAHTDLFDQTIIIDIDGKALLRKSDIKHKIPKKYRGFVGEEIYVGHMLVPNTLAFSTKEDANNFDF